MKVRPPYGFTLVESLCMMVSLLVFGWLCVGVGRNYIKTGGFDAPKPKLKYAAEERFKKEEAPKTDAPKGTKEDGKPWDKMVPESATPAPAKP